MEYLLRGVLRLVKIVIVPFVRHLLVGANLIQTRHRVDSLLETVTLHQTSGGLHSVVPSPRPVPCPFPCLRDRRTTTSPRQRVTLPLSANPANPSWHGLPQFHSSFGDPPLMTVPVLTAGHSLISIPSPSTLDHTRLAAIRRSSSYLQPAHTLYSSSSLLTLIAVLRQYSQLLISVRRRSLLLFPSATTSFSQPSKILDSQTPRLWALEESIGCDS